MSDPVHPRTGSPDAAMDSLARVLPDPPPPRPARRAAAIASALERFEGRETPRSAAGLVRVRPLRGRWLNGRTQVAVLTSAALVALIAVPLALEHPGGRVATPSVGPPPSVNARVPVASAPTPSRGIEGTPPSAPSPTADPRSAAVVARSRPNADATPPVAAPASAAPEEPVGSTARPPPPPPPAAPAPTAALTAGALADASSAAQRASPVEEDNANIVVTGSRISRQTKAASRRGDWNACTLADPEQSLRGCGGLVRTGRGAAGAAGERVAAGLARGWQGDWSGALEAFDQAIALQPRLGIAHLNRGLAHERLGASDEALADLDRAVRFDPSARSYYARSRARRDRGDVQGARADADHAVEIDPNYAKAMNY